MKTCPQCGRKIGDPTPGVAFTMPDHLNYLKTAQCPASGRRFVKAGVVHEEPTPQPAHTGGMRRPDLRMAALAAILAIEGRPRRW
jgi:hypothetical protein